MKLNDVFFVLSLEIRLLTLPNIIIFNDIVLAEVQVIQSSFCSSYLNPSAKPSHVHGTRCSYILDLDFEEILIVVCQGLVMTIVHFDEIRKLLGRGLYRLLRL